MKLEATLEEIQSDYDWREVFTYTNYDRSEILKVIASVVGENDGANWTGIFEMRDGKFLWVTAGCDYTGWDCQAGGYAEVFDSLEAAMGPNGIPRDDKEYLGWRAEN